VSKSGFFRRIRLARRPKKLGHIHFDRGENADDETGEHRREKHVAAWVLDFLESVEMPSNPMYVSTATEVALSTEPSSQVR